MGYYEHEMRSCGSSTWHRAGLDGGNPLSRHRPPPPRPGCYTNLPLLSHLIPVQLPVPDDDKIGSRIYFSKEVSQLQERPHFVTRAQDLNLKTIHCIQLL